MFIKKTTSNDDCRREEKCYKHWSFFTKFLSSNTKYLFIYETKSKAIVMLTSCIYIVISKHSFIYIVKKKTELSELEYLKTPSHMINYAH